MIVIFIKFLIIGLIGLICFRFAKTYPFNLFNPMKHP